VESLLGLVLACLILMSTAWFQRTLERRVIASLVGLSGGRVEIARFRFNPWIFHVTLQNLVIHGTEPAGEAPLISVKSLEAGVSPAQLLLRRLRLRHLDIDHLEVHLRTNSQGITNLPVLWELTSAQQGLMDLMDLSIGRLTVSHSLFFWNDQRQPMEINARDLAILFHRARGRYNGTFSSSATEVRSARWSPPPIKLNGRFELSSAGLVVSSLAWEALGTTGEASFTIVPGATLQASARFHFSADLAAVSGILQVRGLRSGALQVEGLATYEGGAISARGRAQARHVAIFTPSLPSVIVDGTANYAWEDNRLDLTNLVVGILDGTAQGTFQADFHDVPAKFRFNGWLRQVRLDSLLRSASTFPNVQTQLQPAAAASGRVSATWAGQWNGLSADFDLSLQAPASALRNVLPVSGVARGTLRDGHGFTLHLADAELRTPHSTITARGTLAQKAAAAAAESLALTVMTNDFEEWRPFFQALVADHPGIPLELKSRAEFSGQLSGSYEAPSVEGRLAIGQFRYRGWAWDRLTATLALDPNLIRVSNGRLERERSSFEIDASARIENWRFTSRSLVHVSAQAQHTPIEGLKAAVNADIPLSGSVSGRVELQGTTATLTGSGWLRIDDGAFADEPFDFLTTQVQVAKSAWKLQNIQLRKGRGRLSGEITLDPERRAASGQMEGADFRLADIRHLPITASLTRPEGRVDGKLSFTARGRGTADSFRVQSSWQVRDLSVAGTPWGDLGGTVTGSGNQLKLEGGGQGSGGQKFRLSATATAQGDWPMEAQGQCATLRADPWIRTFFNRQLAATVTMDGSFRAQGPLRVPSKITFQAQAASMAVDFPSVQWRNVKPIDVRYSDGTLTLGRFVMRGPATELELAGTVGLSDGGALSLSAAGTANATVLALVDPAIQASGHSALRLRVTGTPAHPQFSGTAEIQDVTLGIQGLPLTFNGLKGLISLEGERAVIRSLRGTGGGGGVAFSGFATLTENPRFELRADLNQVRIPYPTSFTSVLDGHLRLGGSAERSEVQGDLVIRQMIVRENGNLIAKFIESANPMSELPGASASPSASKIRMNVRVTSAPSVQIQTPDFRLVTDVDVRIQGTLANPVQVGSIHFISGETVFRGNRFTLLRGDVNLTNPFRTQAYLDLEAQTLVQSYQLTVDISGPFDRLKFAYRSDPPLTQADIITLLALGYVPQEQAFPTLQGNPATSVGASAILSQALSSQIGGRIQHLFGVSRIKIDPYVGMPGLGSGERVTVEQQISHQLTLTYITDTSYSQYTIVQFEWNVTNNVSILGVRDPNGIFGIEFRFRSRFK
jgi:translocation and assembly module TamB